MDRRIKHGDLSGRRFGRILVLEFVRKDKQSVPYYKCRCDCGTEKVFNGYSLLNGITKSCKCYNKDVLKKHGACFSGKTKEYLVWVEMRARCNNAKHRNYHNYGGRGISVCKEWEDYSVFISYMGERPSKDYSIDRIDNNGNYCKENCRWATRKEQNNNRRTNRLMTLNGITKTSVQWARELGFGRSTINNRIKSGWSDEKILTTPKMQ